MKALIVSAIGFILTTMVGLILAALYQDRISNRNQRWRRRKEASAIERDPSQGAVAIAGYVTRVHLIDGNGQMIMEPENLHIGFRSSSVELPDLVSLRRSWVVKTFDEKKRSSDGKIIPWNSENLVALERYSISRAGKWEDPSLRLETRRVDYATFAATIPRLDQEFEVDGIRGITLRRAYLSSKEKEIKSVEEPIPFLANGLGVALLVFSVDGKVIITRRREGAPVRANERDVSVVEGFDAVHDASETGRLDVIRACVRGCKEELGISIREEEVKILGFAVDLDYYQWSFLGMVDSELSSQEILHRYSIEAKDRWEGRVEAVEATPRRIFELLRRDGIWDLGLVTVYLCLCKKFGAAYVRKAADSMLGSPPRRGPWKRAPKKLDLTSEQVVEQHER